MVVISPMTMKFVTGMKLYVFYTVVTNRFVTSILSRNYDIISCTLGGLNFRYS